MEAQEVFDTVVAHLRKQGMKSEIHPKGATFDNDKFCAYRGPDGLSCAAGCLIHDDEYAAWMENTQFNKLMDMRLVPDSMKERLGPHRRLINYLQTVHDVYDVNQWEERLKSVAHTHELVYTPPEGETQPHPTTA